MRTNSHRLLSFALGVLIVGTLALQAAVLFIGRPPEVVYLSRPVDAASTAPIAIAEPSSDMANDPALLSIHGVGRGTHTLDLPSGVYVASIGGETVALDVTMRSDDGRSTLTWGHQPFTTFTVGDYLGSSLYAGATVISVVPPTPETRWGILFEHHAFPCP